MDVSLGPASLGPAPDLGLGLHPALGVIGIFGGHDSQWIGFRQQIMLIST